MSLAEAFTQVLGTAVTSAGGTAIERAKQKRDEAIQREGWDRQDARIADERAYQKAQTDEQRAYDERIIKEQQERDDKLRSEERAYQEGREDRAFDRQMKVATAKEERKKETESQEKKKEKSEEGATTYRQATQQLEILDNITDDDISRVTGALAVAPTVRPGTRNAEAKFNQLLASGFMERIPQMKGMGALSNAEGSKVTAAYTSLVDPETNTIKLGLSEDFVKSEIEKLREGSKSLQMIGQFYAQNGREPTIEEWEGMVETSREPETMTDTREQLQYGAQYEPQKVGRFTVRVK